MRHDLRSDAALKRGGPVADRLRFDLDDGLLRVVAFSSGTVITVALLAEVEEALLAQCKVRYANCAGIRRHQLVT